MVPPTGRLVLSSVVVVAAVLLASCGDDEGSGIETAQVTTGDVAETVEAPASVTPRSTVSLSSPAEGTVADVQVVDGATVERGDVIVVIDSPQAEQTLADAKQAQREARAAAQPAALPDTGIDEAAAQADEAAEAAFDIAEQAVAALPPGPARDQAAATLEQQRAAYVAARSQAVAASQSVTAAVTSLQRSVQRAVSASTAQLNLAVDAAQRTVDALTVTAPTAGVVTLGGGPGSDAGVDPSDLLGSLPSGLQGAASSLLGGSGGAASTGSTIAQGLPVSTGQTLATITDTSALGLSAQVDETDILLVQPGIPARVQLDAVPDASYSAKVTSVGVTPTTSSRGGVSYIVRLSLGRGTDADGARAPAPRPGMSAVAALEVRTATDVVTVPASAVFREDGRDQVWVVVDGVAERRQVRTGAEGADTIAIESGLNEGETVVVRGTDQVQDGQEIP